MARYGEGRCFVISEIGPPDSIGRKRADRFMLIIEEALRVASQQIGRAVVAERLDWDRTSKNFFEQAIQRILGYELVFAVLTNRNPNAHIELGIALSAARRIIILLEGEEEMPSDLNGHQYFKCNLFDTNATVQELARNVMAELEREEPVKAFGKHNALGKAGHAVHYYNRFKEMSFAEWSQVLWEAESTITIATTNLNYVCQQNRTFFYSRAALDRLSDLGESVSVDGDLCLMDLLAARALAEGIKVRLLLMHVDNPFFSQMMHTPDAGRHESIVSEKREESLANLKRVAAYFQARSLRVRDEVAAERLAEPRMAIKPGGALELVLIKRGPLYSRVTLTDRQAIVTPFFIKEGANSENPCFVAYNRRLIEPSGKETDNNLYRKVADDLDVLYAMNSASAVSLSDEGSGSVPVSQEPAALPRARGP